MKSIQIRPSLFFMMHAYFVHGEIEYNDEIREGLIEKMEKMRLREFYSVSKKAATEEEREAAMQAYLALSAKVKANSFTKLI